LFLVSNHLLHVLINYYKILSEGDKNIKRKKTMNKKEIKVSNPEALVAKIKELVAEDSSWRLAEEYWVTSTTSCEPDGSEKVIKQPRQGVKLTNGQQELNIYCEVESPFVTPSVINREGMEKYLKMGEEISKIIEGVNEKNDFPSRPSEPVCPNSPTSPTKPTPLTPPTPIGDGKDDKEVFWSSRYFGCPSLARAKELIKEYYQEHQKEIQKNTDFFRWIKVESRERERERRNFMFMLETPKSTLLTFPTDRENFMIQ
jgi:hypothetical protein